VVGHARGAEPVTSGVPERQRDCRSKASKIRALAEIVVVELP
jgi:hypothetical protein